MRTNRPATVTVTAAALLLGASLAAASPPPWQRTETRADCDDFETLRKPHFGELHIHTGFSHDAYIFGTRIEPRDAYDFAKGSVLMLPDEFGNPNRPVQLGRPLDFNAVTDHAEFFGEVRICLTPGEPGHDADLCVRLRELTTPEDSTLKQIDWGLPVGQPAPPPSHDFCEEPGVGCDAAAVSVWQDIQAAAEEAYDRTSSCSFTSFIGYEHTASPVGSHLHRNVLFRNENVPSFATSYLETGQNGAAQPLWTALEQDCIDAGTGCEVMTIPHNSNLSGGMRWPDPVDADDARRRQVREPMVEIFQNKSGSECRFDRLAGLGAGTADELCTFEQNPRDRQGPFGRPPIDEYPLRNLVRNVLKDGLAFDQSLGVNPFKLGIIASTDNHAGTSGKTDEDDWNGSSGHLDATPETLIDPGNALDADRMRNNPGGLAVIWAEENSRDALYEALARRETYGTSGSRPVLRFFGGRLKGVSCDKADLVERSYTTGAPMGGDLGAVNGTKSPRFVVQAFKDPGVMGSAGIDLQRAQIVKGWVDGAGEVHERIFEVAGDADNGAGVDLATCAPTGSGAAELCTVWTDPEFDPDVPSFYYVRLLENPSCRWSVYTCRALGVDPLAPDCETQAAIAGDFETCCRDEDTDAFAEPIIQERAWSSPIWYRPQNIARAKGKVSYGKSAGEDRLSLKLSMASLASSLIPISNDIRLTVRDDDTIVDATLAAGAMEQKNTGKFVFDDKTGANGGLRKVVLKIRSDGSAVFNFKTVKMDLSAADRSDHMVVVELGGGPDSVSHVRLWQHKGSKLAPK